VPRYFYGFPADGLNSNPRPLGPDRPVDAASPFKVLPIQHRVQTEMLANPHTDETPAILSMSPADRQQVTYLRGIQKIDRYVDAAPQETYYNQLADMFDKRTASYWPKCNVTLICCEKSSREAMTGARELEIMYMKNQTGRQLNVTMFRDAGHLVSAGAFCRSPS
jgi:hypothetical protein